MDKAVGYCDGVYGIATTLSILQSKHEFQLFIISIRSDSKQRCSCFHWILINCVPVRQSAKYSLLQQWRAAVTNSVEGDDVSMLKRSVVIASYVANIRHFGIRTIYSFSRMNGCRPSLTRNVLGEWSTHHRFGYFFPPRVCDPNVIVSMWPIFS